MKNIIEKIKELGFDEYAAVEKNGVKYLLVFMSYGYYNETDTENFLVSPYYFASNKSYFAAKELAQYIGLLGYNGKVENKIVYDELLKDCGAVRGDNNLFFIESLGSLFCVHIISTDAPLKAKTLTGKRCTQCNKCIAACPTGALNKTGVDKDKCLRERMDNPDDSVCMEKITTLLGCDICQRVCPNNSTEIKDASYPQFNKTKILNGDIKDLAELIGKNMARKQRLQFQAMCAVANRKEARYLFDVENIDNKALSEAKNWCVERLKNIDLQ